MLEKLLKGEPITIIPARKGKAIIVDSMSPFKWRYVDMLDNYQKQLLYKMKPSLDEIDKVIDKLKADGESEKDILRVIRHWIGKKEDGVK